MNKFQKILIGTVISLIILNAALLGFIWTNRPNSPHRTDHRRGPEISTPLLIRQLDLSKEQKRAFQQQLRAHRTYMSDLNREFILRKRQVNRAIIKGDTAAIKATNKALFEAQLAMERETQKLTAQLAAICTEKQKQRFLETIDDAMDQSPSND